MIIWINGAFGSGKTTVAELLHKKIVNSYIYDPEEAGYFIWNNMPKELSRKGDFQDLRIWRSINYQMIEHLYNNYNGAIIIPMTIVKKECYDEIIDRLIKNNFDIHHFILSANREVLYNRLIERGEVNNSWPEQQIDRCLDAFNNFVSGEIIDTNNIGIEEITDLIIKKMS